MDHAAAPHDSRFSHLLYWVTVGVVGLYAAFSLYLSVLGIGQTFAGFQVLSDGRVSNQLAANWNGAKVALPWQHPVVTVDGAPVASGHDFARLVSALPPEKPVTYGFQTGTEVTYRTVVTQTFGVADWLGLNFIAWLLGVGYLVCGAVVSRLRPGHRIARLHFITCMCSAAYFLAVPDAQYTYHLVQAPLYWVLCIWGLGAWGMLAAQFPRPLPHHRRWQLGWLAVSVLVTAWALADCYSGGTTGITMAWLGWGTLSALALPASAAWAAWSAGSSVHDRIVGRFLLFGFSLAFAAPITAAWLQLYLGQTSDWVSLTHLLLLAMPGSIAIAIVRHRLFGIEVVYRQTLTYTLAVGGIVALYAAVVAAVRLAIGTRSTSESVVAAIVIALAFGPLRDRIKVAIDRRFSRQAYEPTMVMAEFHRQASETPDPDHILAAYATCLSDAMGLRWVTIELLDGSKHQTGMPDDRSEALPPLPLMFEDQQLGHVSLGGKRSDLPLNEVDRRLIAVLTGRLELWLHLIGRLETERRHQEMIASLQRSDEMKSEFLNLVSHELRRPLSEILATVNILAHYERQATADPRSQRHLQRLQTSTAMLSGLVNDLMDAGQLQSGRFCLRPSALDIPQVVDDALNAVRPGAEQKGVLLQIDVPACPPAWGDHLRLVQVLTNLLSNAIRHTAPEGIVAVRVDPGETHWRCEVRDSGEGIADSQLPNLFQRFGGAGAGAQRPGGGIGLGLYICRSIITAHGGDIVVASKLGAGSTFTFDLPLVPPETLLTPSAELFRSDGSENVFDR